MGCGIEMLTSSAFRFSTFAEKSCDRGQKQKDMPRYQQQQKSIQGTQGHP